MTVVQIGGMAVVGVSGLLPSTAAWIGWATHLAAFGLVESARLVDVMPLVTTRLPPPAWWAIAAYYAAWLIALCWRRTRPVAIVAGVLAAAWIVAAPDSRQTARGMLSVTWTDVGQGDSELIQFPTGEAWIVDAGGTISVRFDIARRVVEPALWARGVRRLDRLVVTHGDNDHAGGAPSLVRDLVPADIWEGTPVPSDQALAALRKIASDSGAIWRYVQRGDHCAVGPVAVDAWNPATPNYERPRVRNDDSVVLALRWGDVLIVLPGDIESATEADLAAAVVRAPLTIVQAPHHGSKSSSSAAWLAALHPAVVMVSVGRNNRFGHPAPATINRCRELGATIFRTDQDGAITVTTDGHIARIETISGRRMVLTPAGKTAVPPS
jgi:competence protein ComEC